MGLSKKVVLLLILTLLVTNVAFASQSLDKYSETVFIEAENYDYISDGMSEFNDVDASGGKIVKTTSSSVGAAPENMQLKYNISVERDTFFTVWLRVSGHTSWAAYFSVNSDSPQICKLYNQSESINEYVWVKLADITFYEGMNTLNFAGRKSGLFIDSIILCKDSLFVPEGKDGRINPDVLSEEYVNRYELNAPALNQPHPRLLIKSGDVEKIKGRLLLPEHINIYNKVVEDANQSISCVLSDIPDGADCNKSSDCLAYIEANAFLCLINKDASNAQKAILGITEYLETFKARLNGPSLGRTREGGQAIFVASEVYDWCYNYLSEENKTDIIRLCKLHAYNMEIGWPPSVEKAYLSGHSNEAQLMKDLFAFAIAVNDEYPDAYNYVSDRIFNEYIPTLNFFYESAMHNQGGKYGRYRHTFELYLKWILNSLGFGNLIDRSQHYVSYGFIYDLKPDGSYFANGDYNLSSQNYSSGSASLMLLSGNLYSDPYLRQEFYRTSNKGYIENIGNSSHECSPVHFLMIDDPAIGLATINDLPLSRWHGKQCGIMTARTGWDFGSNSNVMAVTMKIPEKYFKAHEHLDSGEFEVYYKGSLALDSGYYDSFGSKHDYGYAKQTIAHNCLLIDNPNEISLYGNNYPISGGQKPPVSISSDNSFEDIQGWATDFGSVLGYDYGENINAPSYTYLKGDLTKAYNGKAQKYIRTFMFENLFNDIYPGALIVLDKVLSDSAQTQFKKTWLLHSQEEPEINGNTTIIKNNEGTNNGKLVNTTLLPTENMCDIKKVGGEGSEFLSGTTNYPVIGNNESGNWRVELSYKTETSEEYFLNVIYVSENNDLIAPLECVKYETEDYLGVAIKDRICFLSKDDVRRSEPFQLSCSSNYDLIEYSADNLKSGTWSVIGNEYFRNVDVSENGGVLTFKAPPGNYNISYVNSISENKGLSLENGMINSEKTNLTFIQDNKIQNLDVEIINGNIYASIQNIAEFFNAEIFETEEGTKLTKDNYYLIFSPESFEVKKYSKYKYRGTTVYTRYPPTEKDGKLYVALSDCANIVQNSVVYMPYMNTVSLMSGSNPTDTLMDNYTFSILKNQNSGGTITGADEVVAGKTSSYEIRPNEGYYIKSIKYNGATVCRDYDGIFIYLTPEVKADSHLDIVFEEKFNYPSVFIYDCVYNNAFEKFSATFGRTFDITGEMLKEKGVIISCNDMLPELSDVNGDEVRKYKFIEDDINSELFGVGLINKENQKYEKYYVRNYAVYYDSNGIEQAVYSGESILIQEE